MAQLQQQLRLNESHLVLVPLSLLQLKLISSQKFSSTSKHFILISSFIPEVFEALLLSKCLLQNLCIFQKCVESNLVVKQHGDLKFDRYLNEIEY